MALGDLLRGWLGPAQETDKQHGGRLAAAVLLLEIAGSDFDLADAELRVIKDSLKRQFDLGAEAVDELLAAAQAEHADSTCLQPYVSAFNAEASREEKRELLASLWRVAHADGVLHHYEEHMMRRIAELLFLSHADYIQTKLAVLGA